MISEKKKERYYGELDGLDRQIERSEAMIDSLDGEDFERMNASLSIAKDRFTELRNRLSEKPVLGDCAACQHDKVMVEWYENSSPPPHEEDGHWFCILCASTSSGNSVIYPSQYTPAHSDTLQAICFVGNEILNSLKTGIHTRESIADAIVDELAGRVKRAD